MVRLREGAEPLTAEALREVCAGKLARFKIPRYVQVIEEFPMTVTGKVRKVELRERGEHLLAAAASHPACPPPITTVWTVRVPSATAAALLRPSSIVTWTRA